MIGGDCMTHIRLSVFPTDEHNYLIAYSNEYYIRDSLANAIRILLRLNSVISDKHLNYQISFNHNYVKYLTFQDGKAIEKLLNYISHREEADHDEAFMAALAKDFDTD